MLFITIVHMDGYIGKLRKAMTYPGGICDALEPTTFRGF